MVAGAWRACFSANYHASYDPPKVDNAGVKSPDPAAELVIELGLSILG